MVRQAQRIGAVMAAVLSVAAAPGEVDFVTGVYRSGSGELDLSFPGVHSDLVDDPSAAAGRVARCAAKPRSAWFIQWPWDAGLLVPKVAYQAVVRLRVDPVPAETPGTLCRVGLYDRMARKAVVEAVVIPVAEVADGRWHEFRLPVFVPSDQSAFLYVSTGDAGERVPWLYVEECRLEPVGQADLAAGLAAIRRRLADDRAFLDGYRPRPAQRVEAFFPFGPAMACNEAHRVGELFGVPWQFVWRERLRDLRDRGSNLAFDLATDAHTPYLEDAIRVAQEEGVLIVGGQSHVIRGGNRSSRTTIDEAAVRDQFRELAARLAAYDRFLFWYLVDEPRFDQCTGFLRGKAIIEECDPLRPALPLMNTPETIARLGPYQQVLITDRYPMYRDGSDPWCVQEWVELARRHARGPVWLMLPAYSSKGMRMTRPAEARLMTWRALAGGARGVLWYCHAVPPHWDRPSHPETLSDPFGGAGETWTTLADEAARLVPLGAVLARCRPAEPRARVACGTMAAFRRELPAVSLGAFEDPERPGLRLLVVGNNDPEQETSATVALDAPAAGLDTATLEPVTFPAELRLPPGAGRVIAVGPPARLAELAAAVWLGRYAQERATGRTARDLAEAHALLTNAVKESLAEAARLAAAGRGEEATRALRRADEEVRAALAGEADLAAMMAALSEARQALSARHRVLVADTERGAEAAVKAGRAALLPLGTRYYALLQRLRQGEGRRLVSEARALATAARDFDERSEDDGQREADPVCPVPAGE